MRVGKVRPDFASTPPDSRQTPTAAHTRTMVAAAKNRRQQLEAEIAELRERIEELSAVETRLCECTRCRDDKGTLISLQCEIFRAVPY